MVIVLSVLLVIAVLVASLYRSKVKEFESLFELSKGYTNFGGDVYSSTDGQTWSKAKTLRAVYEDISTEIENGVPDENAWRTVLGQTIADLEVRTLPPKTRYNKDGSIAKKRGRKSNVKTT